jgi:transcription elongation factor Elf1
VIVVTKRATCPKCGRRDAVDVTAREDEVWTVICDDCGQQPPEQ